MRKYFIILSLGFFSIIIKGQVNDPVVMKVNGKDIKKSEFEYLYKKNNTGIALNEYLELFKNFKLKVAEAEAQGIDTTAAFVKELKENRDQLAKQYLKEPAINESILINEYNRLKEDVEISHIAFPIKLEKEMGQDGKEELFPSSFLFPADTLLAYKKAIQYRNRLLKGEKIDKIASEIEKSYKLPNTPPTYMGWIPAMMMLPTIEDAIFNTPAGSISMPVRFNAIYLLFQIHDKRPSSGEINASHIMVACPGNADTVQVEDARKKAFSIYRRVTTGEDFAKLAKELSDDKGSGQQGGELGWFGTGRMVKEFETMAFSLKKKGDISIPVRSQFGFHIIKLNDVRAMEPFEQKKEQIIGFLSRGERAFELQKPGIDEMKRKSNYTINDNAYKTLKNISETNFPVDTAFQRKAMAINGVLFSIWNKPYQISDFLSFTEKTRSPYFLSTEILEDRYNAYVLDLLRKEENNHLEDEYPEFRNLMKEYHDGFLSYEVTQNEVWEKASKDTLGLTDFFNTNKANYNWDQPHYKGCVVLCKDNKVKKEATKSVKKMTSDEAAKFLTKEFNTDSVKVVKIDKGLFKQGDNSYIDETIFKKGKAEKNKDFPEFFLVGKLLKDGPETYSDIGGQVISDYQNYLEEEWIKKLRAKYPIEVYQDVLKTID